MRRTVMLAAAAMGIVAGCRGRQGKETDTMRLRSPAFGDGERIPAKHTADGADVSPPLSWPEAPEGAKAFVLICDDPDAPVGNWVHWVLYDLPPDTRELP